MKHKLKRYYGRKDLHFITFSCYQRKPLLGSARARNLFLKVLAEVRRRYGFLLIGYVLMPEHVHLLIGEPAKGTPSKVMQVLKQRVSRAMRGKKRSTSRGQLTLPFPRARCEPKRFWQRRFYDFNVWSRGKTKEKLNYMHAHPVLRGLAEHPGSQGLYLQTLSYRRSCPWSSWSFYETGDGVLLEMDSVD